jgi:hypothetical protein
MKRRFQRRAGLLAAVMLVLAAPAPVSAVECAPASGLSTCIDANNLWLRPGGGPFLSVAPSTTIAPGALSFGLVTSYSSRPIELRVASPDPSGTSLHAIDNQVDTTFLWALGVAPRFELTLAAPVTLYQDGAGLADVLGTDTALSRSTLRDLRFGFAYALLEPARTGPRGGTSLIGRLEFGLPTGDTSAFAGTGSVTVVPSLMLGHRHGRWEVGVEVGARLRPARELAGARVGSQLMASAGVAFDVVPKHDLLTLGVEAFGLYTFGGTLERGPFQGQASTRVLPAEWLATASSAPFMAGDLGFIIGGGGPIPLTSESSVTTPRFRFEVGIRYAPRGRDRDGDGVLDKDDRCPDEPEDRDGFEDDDGCPDPDNDKDGILDAKDRCRDAAEDFDGFQDEDGCPDLDDDGDGVPDTEDQCRSAPEDRDGYQDDDGCPDLDNDGDGIPDAKDRCPNGPEDFDGYQDEDGCPDPDNDGDGILDVDDQCPSEPEDKDGFEDEDGCPDPDNDNDGVLDADDKCPDEAETINGIADDDGCPEPGARTLLGWSGEQVVFDRPARFTPRSARLTPELDQLAQMVATFIRTRLPLDVVIIEAYADRPGDESTAAIELAAARAVSFKAALQRAGLTATTVTAAAGDLSQPRAPAASQLDITVRRAKRPVQPVR